MSKTTSSQDNEWLSRCEDFEQAVLKYKSARFSHFISPHDLAVFESCYRLSTDVCFKAYGGSDDAERVVLGFYPDFSELENEDFPVVSLKISNIGNATHRDVLGSVLGLGIKREMVGDIYFDEDFCVVICEKTAAEYIMYNLKIVGKQKVLVEPCPDDVRLSLQHKFEIFTVIVSSKRLDAVVSAMCRMSRSEAMKCITGENVNLNFTVECNADKKVTDGDIISVRHHGRFVVKSLLGETKKGRMILEIKKYI